MTQYRPCIDLHQGKVKQIVGGSLNNSGAKVNFESLYDSSYYAQLYRDNLLKGGHVIALGPGNKEQAIAALKAWPQGMQYGGGVNPDNAEEYLEAGASEVIVTSYLFENDSFSWSRLEKMVSVVQPEDLVIDLSCRKTSLGWQVATNRWQTVTDTVVNKGLLQSLSENCAEFLVHAADVEGLQAGIDEELVSLLAEYSPIPVTYAGGARSIKDLEMVNVLSKGKVDLTIGSALDIFGGSGVTLQECIEWNNKG